MRTKVTETKSKNASRPMETRRRQDFSTSKERGVGKPMNRAPFASLSSDCAEQVPQQKTGKASSTQFKECTGLSNVAVPKSKTAFTGASFFSSASQQKEQRHGDATNEKENGLSGVNVVAPTGSFLVKQQQSAILRTAASSSKPASSSSSSSSNKSSANKSEVDDDDDDDDDLQELERVFEIFYAENPRCRRVSKWLKNAPKLIRRWYREFAMLLAGLPIRARDFDDSGVGNMMAELRFHLHVAFNADAAQYAGILRSNGAKKHEDVKNSVEKRSVHGRPIWDPLNECDALSKGFKSAINNVCAGSMKHFAATELESKCFAWFQDSPELGWNSLNINMTRDGRGKETDEDEDEDWDWDWDWENADTDTEDADADGEKRTLVDEDQTSGKEDVAVCGSKEQDENGEEEAVDSGREDEEDDNDDEDGSKTHFVNLVAHKDAAYNLINGGYQYDPDSYVYIPVSEAGKGCKCKRFDVFGAPPIDPNLASTEDRLEAFLVTVRNLIHTHISSAVECMRKIGYPDADSVPVKEMGDLLCEMTCEMVNIDVLEARVKISTTLRKMGLTSTLPGTGFQDVENVFESSVQVKANMFACGQTQVTDYFPAVPTVNNARIREGAEDDRGVDEDESTRATSESPRLLTSEEWEDDNLSAALTSAWTSGDNEDSSTLSDAIFETSTNSTSQADQKQEEEGEDDGVEEEDGSKKIVSANASDRENRTALSQNQRKQMHFIPEFHEKRLFMLKASQKKQVPPSKGQPQKQFIPTEHEKRLFVLKPTQKKQVPSSNGQQRQKQFIPTEHEKRLFVLKPTQKKQVPPSKGQHGYATSPAK